MHGRTSFSTTAGGAPDDGTTFLGGIDLVRILRRRWMTIALTVAVIIGATALYLLRATPIYTATAVLEVASSSLASADGAAVVVNPTDELNIATQIELLKSRKLARMVVKDFGLDNDKEFNQPVKVAVIDRIKAWFEPATAKERNPERSQSNGADKNGLDDRQEATVDRVLDRIAVERVARSYLIEVSARSSNPERAKDLADAFAGAHIKRLTASTRNSAKRDFAELTASVVALRERAIRDDRAVASYARSRNLLAATNSVPDVGEMQRLSGRLAEARAARAETEARLRGLSGSKSATQQSAVATSPMLADLRSQEAALRKRIAELSALFGAGHPDMITATAQLGEVQSRMAAEIARIGTDLRNDVTINQAREGQLASEVGGLRSQAFRQGAAGVQLMDLQRAADASQAIYNSQLARLKQVDAQGKDPRAPTSIAARASQPTVPTEPQPLRSLGIALVGSILLGIVLAVVAEAMDTRIRTADQIERLLGIPTYAMVPMLDKAQLREPVHAEIADRPRSLFSEAIRTLYMEVARRRAGRPSQVVTITSPLAGEGKSTLALSLAASGARLGRRTVVVDLDLRRPGLQQAMHRAGGEIDVVAYLEGTATIDQIVTPDDRIPGLYVIYVAKPANDPGALLASVRLKTLIATLRERFDFVVLNAPPVLPVRDAKTIGEVSDTTLMVLHWGRSSPEAARSAMALLEGRAPAAVLNFVDYKSHAKRAYGDSIQHYAGYASYFAEMPRAAST